MVTAPADRGIRARDWGQIAALVGLPPDATPAAVIAALERRGAGKAAPGAERDSRMAEIRGCRRCDPVGWRLGPDGSPIDPAIRCDHGAPTPRPTPTDRDITEPIHERTNP